VSSTVKSGLVSSAGFSTVSATVDFSALSLLVLTSSEGLYNLLNNYNKEAAYSGTMYLLSIPNLSALAISSGILNLVSASVLVSSFGFT
jgi:hypothetical protein